MLCRSGDGLDGMLALAGPIPNVGRPRPRLDVTGVEGEGLRPFPLETPFVRPFVGAEGVASTLLEKTSDGRDDVLASAASLVLRRFASESTGGIDSPAGDSFAGEPNAEDR